VAGPRAERPVRPRRYRVRDPRVSRLAVKGQVRPQPPSECLPSACLRVLAGPRGGRLPRLRGGPRSQRQARRDGGGGEPGLGVFPLQPAPGRGSRLGKSAHMGARAVLQSAHGPLEGPLFNGCVQQPHAQPVSPATEVAASRHARRPAGRAAEGQIRQVWVEVLLRGDVGVLARKRFMRPDDARNDGSGVDQLVR